MTLALAGLWLGGTQPARAQTSPPDLPGQTADAGSIASFEASAPPDASAAKAGAAERSTTRASEADTDSGPRPGTDGGLQTMQAPSTGSDLGRMLLEMLLVLGGVCLLAYAVLRWGLRRLVGADSPGDGPIEIVARRQLGNDRAISIVRVGSRTLVIGESDGGLTRLAELDAPDELQPE